jgi:hypothetical protein
MSLQLTGIVQGVPLIGGYENKKTGEKVPSRYVLQLTDTDERGLVQLYSFTVDDPAPFIDKVGQQITIPVRAWASKTPVSYVYTG